MSRTGFDFPHIQADDEIEEKLGVECECQIKEKDIDQTAAQIIKEQFPSELSVRTKQTISKMEQFKSSDDGLEYRALY